jgi:tRNA-splicing ligase RtcB
MKIDKKLTTLIPLEEIEQGAQDQIWYIHSLDFCNKETIMPDIHKGYTMPIGGVALFDNVVSPACVGYDIHCGMSCVITDTLYDDIIKDNKMEREIFNKVSSKLLKVEHNEGTEWTRDFEDDFMPNNEVEKIDNRFKYQLGTLGGGNHFIEIGKNQDGFLSVVVHSGSRNGGWKIADWYMKKASKGLPVGFLYSDSALGEQYIRNISFASDFTYKSRKTMIDFVLETIGITKRWRPINEHHNSIEVTKNGIIHRKGATPAYKDQIGVIPGNMRDGTFITMGLGNEDYLCSSSHGAGRVGSRNWATKNLSLDDFKEQMDGIVANVFKGTLNESPGAYKDINRVMELQEGIVVNTIDHITPKINIKGK